MGCYDNKLFVFKDKNVQIINGIFVMRVVSDVKEILMFVIWIICVNLL